MSAIANIILPSVTRLENGITFPADTAIYSTKTLSPERFLPGGVAKWVDRSGGIPMAYPTYTQSIRPPTKDSRIYKVQSKQYLPILESVPAPGTYGPVLAYTLQAHLDILLPERSTQAERNKLLMSVVAMCLKEIYNGNSVKICTTGSPLIAAVNDLEDVY